MEKTVSIRNANITFSIWDLGGQREFINMLPLVCNDAAAILFMFDLSRIATLNNVKEWYVPPAPKIHPQFLIASERQVSPSARVQQDSSGNISRDQI